MSETLKSFVEAVHMKYSDDSDVCGVVESWNVVLVPKAGPVKVTG